MVDGSSTKLAVELLSSKTPQILNSERPKMEHIVSGECIPLLHQNHFGSKEAQLYGCTQTTWSSSNDQTLRNIIQ